MKTDPADEIYFIEQRVALAKKEIEEVSLRIEEEERVQLGRKDRRSRRGW